MKPLRHNGSMDLVLGLFGAIFAGMLWYVIVPTIQLFPGGQE